MAYLASNLRKNSDCEIDLIDTTFISDPHKHIEDKFKNNKYDLIGVSLMTSMLNDARFVATIAKKYNPSALVIFGGPHPTVMPESTLGIKQVDAICIGEGEDTFVEIVNNKFNLKGISGVWYKSKGKIIKNGPRMPIEDLDKLPFPAWDMLDMKNYIDSWYQLDALNRDIRGASLIASRGCPYQCTYCQPTLFSIFGKKIRKRSVKNIIAELKELKEKYGINAFGLQDDTFIVDKQWVLDFCKELIRQKLNLLWQCNVRANLITEKLLSDMKKSGLVRIAVGIESANQRVLDEVYRKQITIAQIKETLRIAKKLHLYVHGYFMIGAPTETEKEIKNSIRFARDNYMHSVTFSLTTPLPHTYLYDMSKDSIDRDFSEFDYYNNYVYKGKSFLPQKRLDYLKKMGYLQFHLSPRRIFATMMSFIMPKRLKRTLLMLKRF